MMVLILVKIFNIINKYSETCIKRTPLGNAVVSATGCLPNTGFDR